MDNIQFLWIPGPLPGLNDLQASRNHWSVNKLKKRWYEIIAVCVKQAALRPVKVAQINFFWVERNKRRDKDNIAAGGRKLIFDGLIKAEILKDDGWDEIKGWGDAFSLNKELPGVKLEIYEVGE